MSRLTGTDALGLFEAYQAVYTETEQVDENFQNKESIVEGGFPNVKPSVRAGDAGTSGLKMTTGGYINKHSGGEVLPSGTVNKIMRGDLMVKGKTSQPTTQVAHFDIFDLIKGYLLDEGYADTEETAISIMANMGEEWRNEIVEKFSPNIVTLRGDIETEKAKAELSKLSSARRQRDAASELRSGSYGVPSFARSQEMDAAARHAEAGLTKSQSKQILAQNRRSLETSAGMNPGSTEKDAWYNDPNYGKELTGKGTFFSPRTVLAKQGGKEGKLTTDPNTGKKTFTATNWSGGEKERYTQKGGK